MTTVNYYCIPYYEMKKKMSPRSADSKKMGESATWRGRTPGGLANCTAEKKRNACNK